MVYCSPLMLTVALVVFFFLGSEGLEPGWVWCEGGSEGITLVSGLTQGPAGLPCSGNTCPVPCRCRQCSSMLVPGSYSSGPEEGTFVCAERCTRLGPGGRSGTRPLSLQKQQPAAAAEAKDGEDSDLSKSVVAVAAEADGLQASSEVQPHILTKPPLPSKPQELASPPVSRPTPAPRKASESSALTPPTPRPRSSLQQDGMVEQSVSGDLVNGE